MCQEGEGCHTLLIERFDIGVRLRCGEKYEVHKDMRRIFVELSAQGFRVEEGKKGWKIYPPDPEGTIVVVHSTSSDSRAFQNVVSDLRRAGFDDGRKRKARPDE